MNYHPGKKQLIDYSLDPSNKKASEIAIHLSECEECRKTVKSLSDILMASDNSSIAPPQRLKNRVLGLMNEPFSKSTSPINLNTIIRNLLRPAVFASIFLIAALSILIYTMQKTPTNLKPVMFTLFRNNGHILYNNEILKKEHINMNAGVVKTKELSSAMLNFEAVFTLKIAENTELTIKEAQKSAEKEQINYFITIDMQTGTIFSSFIHNINKKYIISTQHAIFETLGTSFILSSNNSSSMLSLLDGTVRVTLKQDGKILILNKGEGCIANSSLSKIKINPEIEMNKFNIIFNKKKNNAISSDEKKDFQEKTIDTGNLKQNAEKVKSAGDTDSSSQQKQNTDDFHRNKAELKDETKQIQKEIRNNLRSGKKSQR